MIIVADADSQTIALAAISAAATAARQILDMAMLRCRSGNGSAASALAPMR